MKSHTNSGQVIALCTVFDQKYFPQALTMIESVEARTSLLIEWNVLALTKDCYESILRFENSRNWNVFQIEEIEDNEFRALADTRPWREFCWTAASVFLRYVALKTENSFVGYIDADCYFFNDIQIQLEDMGDSSVLIYEHNFSLDRQSWIAKSGKYNVGLILGKTNSDFALCLERWREQVIEECVNVPELGKCGDQTYLNDWPERYPFVKISKRRGACLAPWNLNNFSQVFIEEGKVDNTDIDFFHFHGLIFLLILRNIALYIPAGGYSIETKSFLSIYGVYIRHILQSFQKLGVSPPPVRINVNFIRNLRHWNIALW